ncbi:MAG: BcsR/BcsP family cellulose biosynthesis protein, partial [Stellaceae bacterium]
MDQGDDVERLFSWLKTPDLRYREFADEREVADAVATWPVLRRAAAETVRINEDEAGTPPRIIEERGGPEPVPPPAQPPYEWPTRSFHANEAAGEAPRAQPAPAQPAPAQPALAQPPRRMSPGRETLFGGTYRGFEE